MSKIIVCWNNNAFGEQLKKKQGNDFIVCTCTKDLKGVKKIKDVDLFVVLCELGWDITSSEAPLSDFKGITLVQQYLRGEKGLTAPVVFVSFLQADRLAKFKEDADIIMTPALQHEFLQLPSGNPTEFLLKILDYLPPKGSMKKMGQKDLAYTRMFYCSLKGMLLRIHHSISDFNPNNDGPIENYRKKHSVEIKQIEHIIEHHFTTDKSMWMKELSERDDLHAFCQKLLDHWNLEPAPVHADQTEKYKLKILFLEDNESDENVIRFKEFCDNHSEQFKIVIISDSASMSVLTERENSSNFTSYQPDVVICDIELRDKNGLLQYLGYNMIEEMSAISRKPLYYIVSNVSRSVFDQVKPDIVKRIMLKSEAFGSNANIEKFLYGIKEVLDDRIEKGSNDIHIIFNYFYHYLESDMGFPISFSFTNLKEDGQSEKIEHVKLLSFNELNDFVNCKATEMYDHFKKLIDINNNVNNTCDFLTFNKCCKDFRTQIGNNMQRGGKNFRSSLDMTMEPLQDDLVRFVQILLFRRLFLCIEHFVTENHILEDFNEYRRQNLTFAPNREDVQTERNRRFSVHDLAFRAIGEQFKSLNKSCYAASPDNFLFGNNGTEVPKKTKASEYSDQFRKQSRLDATLLWENKRDLSLKEEEKDFMKTINQQDNTNK